MYQTRNSTLIRFVYVLRLGIQIWPVFMEYTYNSVAEHIHQSDESMQYFTLVHPIVFVHLMSQDSSEVEDERHRANTHTCASARLDQRSITFDGPCAQPTPSLWTCWE